MDPILTIHSCCKVYKTAGKTVVALDDINLTINKGEIFGLLGVNGAGKTTLSSILATVHPPTSGHVYFNDTSIYKDLNTYRQHLGFCPQYQNLDQQLTVEQNIRFAGRYFLLPEHEIETRTNALLEQLDLTRYRHFLIKELSGGNKQRVLIARALIHNPTIVILDEPTVGLDPDIRRTLWDIIRALKEHGITIILTTHYLDEAEYLSDRVCILHKGQVKLVESVTALKEQHALQNLEEIFLQLTKSYQHEMEQSQGTE